MARTYMKRFIIFVVAITSTTVTFSQIKIKNKKYQSLLWEITGNGTKKPSYLFGTMHISSKVVFNLADSFYMGIKNANVVALETNPESWQEDMSKYDLENAGYNTMNSRFGDFDRLPNDYMSIHTLEFGKFEKKIEQALYSNPSVINNLLYRTYGDFSSDFEENTYLDMYIYQVGKKWGKRVAGVESYGESMKLMMEAYRDAAKDKNRKEKSYDAENSFSADKLQEAYRTGNLDLLDSLNKLQSFSNAFDEKFLYRRNEIQANSIDSILKSGSSLFVGVGAAHLPGSRGVIELLRNKGYLLRPVVMEKKADSHQKDSVEKIHVPVSFNTYNSEDGFFKVDLPGKLYGGEDNAGMFDQRQYADMANGSYYIVTRLRTNNVMWGNSADVLYKKIDSVLYENVPGKILNKQVIYKNGYKGFDILNRTRRGDVQRYNIFITPFEIIFFKMSGNDEYVKKAAEANLFFNSIRLKDYNSANAWKKYSPPFGGFNVSLPHEPFISNDGNWLFDAEDKSDSSFYRIVRTDIHNYHFAEADSFDLDLMAESFSSSDFIDKEVKRQLTVAQGYPALDCQYKAKDGSFFNTRFIIQGPHYYSLIAHSDGVNAKAKNFFDSFSITPFIYHTSKLRTDTALYYTVTSPVFPESKKEKLTFPNQYDYLNGDDDDVNSKDDPARGVYRNKLITDDSTRQQIYVSFYKYGRYRFDSDSSWLQKKNSTTHLGGDSTWTVRKVSNYETPQKMKVWQYELTKPGSSRVFLKKDFYKNDIIVSLITQSDTLTSQDAFVKEFFSTFKPSDTLKGNSPFASKSKQYFEDFFNKDSSIRKRAINNIDEFEPADDDLPSLQKAISTFTWKDKKYLETKKNFINKLKRIDSKESADYLKGLYFAAGDTVEIQYAVLETLLQQQTKYSMNLFKDIITVDPPVLQNNNLPDYSNYYAKWRNSSYYKSLQLSDGDFMDELYDSLKLTRTILPNLLPLLNLDDYKWPMMRLLAKMSDSNLVTYKDYKSWFNKFLLEAKLELKKQVIAEKKQSIKKAEDNKIDQPAAYTTYERTGENNKGNDDLNVYATLLLPYFDKSTPVQSLFQQILQSGDEKLKYSTMLLLVRNGKDVPDSLVTFFASKDQYRYELFSDLKDIDKINEFPSQYNNHLDLARSKLLDLKTYDKPDSLVFIDSLPATVKQYKGMVYFFKYKQKKDDDVWKIASAGLVPEDPARFEFDDVNDESIYFNEMSDTKIKEDEPIAGQLQTALKKLLYLTHSSAKEFYDKEDSRYDIRSLRKY
ncbi:MAG: TraB/GumN family protein [Chitinophagaceae bacterium]